MLRLLLICCFGLCALESIQAAPPLRYRPLSREEQRQVALECILETQINPAVITRVIKTVILPENDTKYKEFLACSYKKQGYLSEDGRKILHNNVVQFIEMHYNRTQIEQLQLDRCKSIEAANPGELCFKYLKCILKELVRFDKQ